MYLERKPYQPQLVFRQVLYLVILDFGDLVFVEGGKPENPEKNLQNKTGTNNELNPHARTVYGTQPKLNPC